MGNHFFDFPMLLWPLSEILDGGRLKSQNKRGFDDDDDGDDDDDDDGAGGDDDGRGDGDGDDAE